MTGLGHSRRFWHVRAMSAFPPIATDERTCREVRLVPTTTVSQASGNSLVREEAGRDFKAHRSRPHLAPVLRQGQKRTTIHINSRRHPENLRKHAGLAGLLAAVSRKNAEACLANANSTLGGCR